MRNEMLPTLTFLGSSISYTQNVLTPRLETEALVLGVIRRIQGKPLDAMLDVGTGSGAIAISLKRMFPYIPCFATDISELALQMAQQNAQQNGVDIRFEKGDLLEPVQSVISGARTCCIANLPYIPLTASLPQDVREEDPEIALYGWETWFEKIAALMTQAASLPSGSIFWLWLEFWEGQDVLVWSLAKEQAVPCEFWKDYSGIQRFALIQYGSLS